MKKPLLFGLILFSANLFALQSEQDSQDAAIIQCSGKYALCIATDCLKDTNNPTQAICNCPVYVGENWGTIPCAERASANSNQVYSEYSPIYLLASSDTSPVAKKIFDPNSFCDINSKTTGQYANCLNVLCTLTSKKNATCPCPVITTQASDPGYYMEADNCEKASTICNAFSSSGSDVVINSAPVAFSTRIVNKALDYYDKTVDKSMFCVSQKAEAASLVKESDKDIVKDVEKVNLITNSDKDAAKDAAIKKTLDTFVTDTQDNGSNGNVTGESLDINDDANKTTDTKAH